MKEVWMSIKSFEGVYMVSNYGNVKRNKRVCSDGRILQEKKLTPTIRIDGYMTVHLRIGDINKNPLLHRLVADAFLFNDNRGNTVNHKDGNKKNNHYLNLEWMSQSENNKHALLLGLRTPPSGSNHFKAKKVLDTSTGIVYDTIKDAAIKNGFNVETLYKKFLGKRRNNTHLIIIS